MNNKTNGSGEYKPVSRDYCKSSYRQAAHVLVFARSLEKLWNKHSILACVNMHMRFDGKLGFPGGLIDDGEDTETGLNREVKEELGIDLKITKSDWLSTHYSDENKIVNHFYCKEIDLKEFVKLESSVMVAEEYGIEILGNIRVPLYSYTSGRGKLSGFPQFLKNNFAGNSREQLLNCLVQKEILTQDEVDLALEQSKSL